MAKFKKGQSGNPAGRPRGIPDKRSVFRETLQKEAGNIIQAVIEKALDGDVSAMRICVDRILPTLKSGDTPIRMSLSGSLEEQGQQVLGSMADGLMSPSEATTVMGLLQSQAKLSELSELEGRMQALEESIG